MVEPYTDDEQALRGGGCKTHIVHGDDLVGFTFGWLLHF